MTMLDAIPPISIFDPMAYDNLIRYENEDTHGLHLIFGNTGGKSRVMYSNVFDISPDGTQVLKGVLYNQ